MIIKEIRDENFNHYKLPSMLIAFPFCSFKCERECNERVCQNSALASSPNIEIEADKIVKRYINNNITSAVCLAGLEPLDSFEDVLELIDKLRKVTNDDIVLYTGYYKNEIEDKINILKQYSNIIIKFGRFIPNQKSHKDEVLGVDLASDNQYAEKIN